MMKKVFAVVCTLALAGGVLAGCSGNSDNAEKKSDSAATEQKAAATDEVKAPESDVAMKYITSADAEANLDSSDYVFIDLRKADDYKAGHIKGAIAADMDACKGGDFQNGVDTMKAALKALPVPRAARTRSLCSSATLARPMPRPEPMCFPSSALTWTMCSPSKAA